MSRRGPPGIPSRSRSVAIGSIAMTTGPGRSGDRPTDPWQDRPRRGSSGGRHRPGHSWARGARRRRIIGPRPGDRRASGRGRLPAGDLVPGPGRPGRGRGRDTGEPRRRGLRARRRRGRSGSAGRIAAEATAALGRVDILVLDAGRPPASDPTKTDPGRLGPGLPAPGRDPDRAGHGPPAGDARRRLGPDRGDPVVWDPPADPRPRLFECRPGGPGRLAEDDGPGRRGGRRDDQRSPARPAGHARIDSLDRGRAEGTGQTVEAVRAAHLATIPIGRYGRPDELATLVTYLASDLAGYQTGTFSAVDGGLIAGLP